MRALQAEYRAAIRRRRVVHLIVLALAEAVIAPSAEAQVSGIVQGSVISAETGAALPDVAITCVPMMPPSRRMPTSIQRPRTLVIAAKGRSRGPRIRVPAQGHVIPLRRSSSLRSRRLSELSRPASKSTVSVVARRLLSRGIPTSSPRRRPRRSTEHVGAS
jgi:hypothetical protein